MAFRIHQLDPSPDAPFPPVEEALREPDGLLAMGGDLSPARLLNAYGRGIFPWYSRGQPILWWSPDPRMVFRTEGVRLSSRFRRELKSSSWLIRADTAFEQVVAACALTPRRGQRGTWITAEMQAAYLDLHRLGHAHSVEVFDGPDLVGGIYGVAVGRMFFGESMYSAVSGGSKAALAGLASGLRSWGWTLIDAQVESEHLLSLGAEAWSRPVFMAELALRTAQASRIGSWIDAFGELPARSLAGAESHAGSASAPAGASRDPPAGAVA